MSVSQLLSLAVFTIFAENLVLNQLLGVRLFLGASRSMGAALGAGCLMTVVMGLTSLCSWAVDTYLLIPLGLDGYLQTVAFVLVIVALVCLLNVLLKQVFPALYAAIGDSLPLVAVNSGVLGIALQNAQIGAGAMDCVAYGILGGLGFMLATVLFACVQERLEFADCPKAFDGAPIVLVSAGLLAMAFMGFSNLRLH